MTVPQTATETDNQFDITSAFPEDPIINLCVSVCDSWNHLLAFLIGTDTRMNYDCCKRVVLWSWFWHFGSSHFPNYLMLGSASFRNSFSVTRKFWKSIFISYDVIKINIYKRRPQLNLNYGEKICIFPFFIHVFFFYNNMFLNKNQSQLG